MEQNVTSLHVQLDLICILWETIRLHLIKSQITQWIAGEHDRHRVIIAHYDWEIWKYHTLEFLSGRTRQVFHLNCAGLNLGPSSQNTVKSKSLFCTGCRLRHNDVWGRGTLVRGFRWRGLSRSYSLCHSDSDCQLLSGFNLHYGGGLSACNPLSTDSHKKTGFMLLYY